jgi:hypothetical protein
MAAHTCSRCGGRQWVRYFSETTDGGFEEAFMLCPCNYRSEAERGADYYSEEPDWAKNISREKPVRYCTGVIKVHVKMWHRRSL